jgi:cobalt-precorrin-5B (C1)-methyltransferase
MFGKAVKLAEGHTDTHSRESTFNPGFAVQIATRCGYDENVIREISQVKLANAIRDILPFSSTEPFYLEIARRGLQTVQQFIGKDHPICFFLLTEKGEILVSRN